MTDDEALDAQAAADAVDRELDRQAVDPTGDEKIQAWFREFIGRDSMSAQAEAGKQAPCPLPGVAGVAADKERLESRIAHLEQVIEQQQADGQRLVEETRRLNSRLLQMRYSVSIIQDSTKLMVEILSHE